MNKTKMTQEQISALADGELSDAHINVALAALRQPDARASWEVYHQIGDVLRSDDMAVTLSPDFAARMAARLEAEPTIVAPVPEVSRPFRIGREQAIAGVSAKRAVKRFAIPGAIAAAVASIAFVTTPQLMVAMKGSSSTDNPQTMVASAAPTMTHASVISASAPQAAAVSPAAAQEAVVLRDQRIDEYLLAHQRFSPSVYSTAQFARSATFATDSDK